MEQLTDIRLWVLIILVMAWIMRTKRALTTLKLVPQLRARTYTGTDAPPQVSIIIPAKNEEENIGACVEGFLNQDYPNLEIIVINDNSSDRTGDILASFGEKITVIDSPKTPEGWTGKNHALHAGTPSASGQWLLFTDADTRHERTSVSSAMMHVQQNNLSLLTLTPRCLTGSFIENLVQPCAMAHTGLWFPLEKVNEPASNVIFGNGQYLMIERRLYRKIGGHKNVKEAFLEDFALVKKAKHVGARFQAALGTNLYGTRMYTDFESIWNGWRRIFLHAFDQNAKVLLSKFFGVLFFSILPFTSIIPTIDSTLGSQARHGAALGLTFVLITVIYATAWKAYGLVKGKRIYVLLYPAACFFLAVILLDAWWMAFRKKKTVWR